MRMSFFMPELALFEIQMKFPDFLLACISAGMFMLMPKFFFTSMKLGIDQMYCSLLGFLKLGIDQLCNSL